MHELYNCILLNTDQVTHNNQCNSSNTVGLVKFLVHFEVKNTRMLRRIV